MGGMVIFCMLFAMILECIKMPMHCILEGVFYPIHATFSANRNKQIRAHFVFIQLNIGNAIIRMKHKQLIYLRLSEPKPIKIHLYSSLTGSVERMTIFRTYHIKQSMCACSGKCECCLGYWYAVIAWISPLNISERH